MRRIERTDRHYTLRVTLSSALPKSDQMLLTETVEVELFDGRVLWLPGGFVTDCHSTPRLLDSLLPHYDAKTNLAAIVHDYLYECWEQAFWVEGGKPNTNGRDYADHAYRELMERFRPGHWRNPLYYLAVRWFGGWNWKKFRQSAVK